MLTTGTQSSATLQAASLKLLAEKLSFSAKTCGG
jgi:hypothetical protein